MKGTQDAIARAICQEQCAFLGEPPCWHVDAGWPNRHCDEPGCQALAKAVVAATAPHDEAAEIASWPPDMQARYRATMAARAGAKRIAEGQIAARDEGEGKE